MALVVFTTLMFLDDLSVINCEIILDFKKESQLGFKCFSIENIINNSNKTNERDKNDKGQHSSYFHYKKYKSNCKQNDEDKNPTVKFNLFF